MGGEHQPHEEAGLCSYTEENDHNQVRCAAATLFLTTAEFKFTPVLIVRKSVASDVFLQGYSSPEFPRLHLPDRQLDREAHEAEGRDRPRGRHRPL